MPSMTGFPEKEQTSIFDTNDTFWSMKITHIQLVTFKSLHQSRIDEACEHE